MVKIKMILSKIRKRTDRKINTRNTAEYKRMRRHFHNYMRTSGALHFSKKLLKLKAFRRCTLGVDKLTAYHIAVCAYKSDLGADSILKQVLEKICRCSLSVCSGNADYLHFSGRITEKVAA